MWMLFLSQALAGPTEPEKIERRVVRALPNCQAVEARVQDPVPVLLSLVERSPDPKVRQRAATCLLEQHLEASNDWQVEDVIADWMHAPDAELASLVLSRLETLPVPVAVGAATAGLRGPHAPMVEAAVQSSSVPLVRATLILDGD